MEIRTRNLNLEAIGRAARTWRIPATDGRTDADSLGLTLVLPPGWRVFALFGADRVDGDWLTAWSLLDLFLLLDLLARRVSPVGRDRRIVALLAFGLAYHEPGAPRLAWLFLLMPVALLRVVPQGHRARWSAPGNTWRSPCWSSAWFPSWPVRSRARFTRSWNDRESTYAPRGMFRWLGVGRSFPGRRGPSRPG